MNLTLLRRRIALVSALSRVRMLFKATTKSETKKTPQKAISTPIILPKCDYGKKSPYPTVVSVIRTFHIAVVMS